MNHTDVQLIGVFPSENDEPFEAFVYTTDAPTNLWVNALCNDNSRMGLDFIAYGINSLIEEDKFDPGDYYDVVNAETGVILRFMVDDEVPKAEVEAYGANTPTVRVVKVLVLNNN